MKTSSRVSAVLLSLAMMVALSACAAPGPSGAPGRAGRPGVAGHAGANGVNGAAGANGENGAAGGAGAKGASGSSGAAGAAGAIGAVGAPGVPGPVGPAGAPGSGEAAEFFALMPPDNAFPVFPGVDVQFPQDGPTTTLDIHRIDAASFDLALVGVYQVTFQVPVVQSGQLALSLNGLTLPYTVVGRATGTTQIQLTSLVQTTTADSILTVQNPFGASATLTVDAFAGGNLPAAATLVIALVKAN